MTLPPSTEVHETKLTISARDGYPLSALRISSPSPDTEPPRAGLMITAGTGFPKSYYRHFAHRAAKRGYCVYLYDCRGIGGSAPDDLAQLKMEYTDWGRYDMPAVADHIADEMGGKPLLHVGHSVGGHFVGFMDNHDKIKAHAFVCVGSGYWRGHHLWYRPFVLWFWHGHGARSVKKRGYVSRGGGWTGQPLPKGVFSTWKRWCAHKDYFLPELKTTLKPHYFADVKAPIRSFIYTDDPIANEKAGQFILNRYPNAKTEMLVQSPKELGLKRVGHNGPFTKATNAASDAVLSWLDTQPS
ncbi:MAG: alpha/beta fold hydrolase [Pseudomonadota bacterium]